MKKFAKFFVAFLALFGVCLSVTVNVQAKAGTDKLTATSLNMKNSYKKVNSDVSKVTGARYSTFGYNSDIQWNESKGDCGLVSIISGGFVESIKMGVGTKNVEIYGSNTAYISPSDLYNDTKKGDTLAVLTGPSTYTFTKNYKYFGIKNTKTGGAQNIKTIDVKWKEMGELVDVTLDLNYTGAPTASVEQVVKGENYTLPLTATRVNYTFDGWHTDPVLESRVTELTNVQAATTLYAHWIEKELYTVTLKSNNGTDPFEMLVYDGEKLDLQEWEYVEPTKPGYTFDGWYTDLFTGEKVDLNTFTATADATLYAHWNKTDLEYVLNYETLGSPTGEFSSDNFKFTGLDKAFNVSKLTNEDQNIKIGSGGYIYNVDPIDNLKMVSLFGKTNAKYFDFYQSDEVITSTEGLTPVTANNNEYQISKDMKYIRIQCKSDSQFARGQVRLTVEDNSHFSEVKTLAKLALTYTPNEDANLATLNDVTLRFGGLIEKDLYQPDLYEYGVIILAKDDLANIDKLENLTRADLEALKDAHFAIESTKAAEEGGKIQFSWKIERVPGEYRTMEFVSVLYMIDKDTTSAKSVATISQHRYGSIKSVANDYLLNQEALGLTDPSLIKVLTDLSVLA